MRKTGENIIFYARNTCARAILKLPFSQMKKFTERFVDLVLSVYLYNEWRGYMQMEEMLIPKLEADPTVDPEFLAAVKKHCADEKKHYNMFKGWFHANGRMPFNVGRSIGYFDALTDVLIGRKKEKETLSDETFAKLCRAIVITEYRGINQIATMLKWRSIRNDERLHRIFEVIEQDEPSHFLPYSAWLKKKGFRAPSILEKVMDVCVHYTIAAFIIPAHYLNFRLKRVEAFVA